MKVASAVCLTVPSVSGEANAAETTLYKTGSNLKAVRFRVDVTPPVGERIAYDITEKPGTPIYVSGIVLDDGTTRSAWISCDFIYLCGENVEQWRSSFAKIIGCPSDNIFLHSVHQHDTPLIYPQMYGPSDVKPPSTRPMTSASKSYCDSTLAAVSDTIAKAVAESWTPVAKVYTAEQRVGQLGAARSLVDEKGVCVGVRFSTCRNDKLREWPVGEIDTILRTICFEGKDGKKFVALHFYATHPMASYLRKMVGPDVPGFAVQYAQKHTPELMHIYFNGCGGNVTFGKYNLTGDQAAIESLGTRMGKAMLLNLDLLQERPIGPIRFIRSTLDVPFDLKRFNLPNTSLRRKTALRTLDHWKKATVTRFSLGPEIHALSIGLGEVCVEYQLYAQSLVPDLFLATAAYVNGVYEYAPLAKVFVEGGCEASEQYCPVTPEIEPRLKAAIRDVLNDLRN